MVCQYDPHQHELLDNDVSRWLKRETSDPELRKKVFVYRHLRYGTFVIGLWINAPQGVFVDVLNMGTSLANLTASNAQELRKRLFAPTAASDMAHQMQESYSEYLHRRQDESDGMTDRMMYGRKVAG